MSTHRRLNPWTGTTPSSIGGGHNGLACAAYLAEAGRSVVVLERNDVVGGAARSARVFPAHDALLSKYSYLVSLLPAQIVDELGLDIELRRRDVPSPAASLGALGPACATLAERVFPTLTEPLRGAGDFRRHIGDEAWRMFVERPIGEAIEEHIEDDTVRGIVLTDALIGTFTHAHDLLANRCFLYHVVGAAPATGTSLSAGWARCRVSSRRLLRSGAPSW